MGYGALKIDPWTFPDPVRDIPAGEGPRKAVLAGGCFWCTEAVYKELDGVAAVRPVYTGGDPGRADYRSVCSGTTGHAEAIEIDYDPRRVSYGQLLRMFFAIAHDPTQLNRQGNDVGTQYRSAIFYASEEEKAVARAYMDQIEASGLFAAPLATTLEPLGPVHPAEEYHHDYASRNPGAPYIVHVSAPKVAKLRKTFPAKLKKR